MAQNKGPRLEGRNGRIWARYLAGWTQQRIADECGISQQYVSEIIREVRDSIPEEQREHLVTTEVERLDRALAEAFDVMETPHYVVNAGKIVHEITEYAQDDDGNVLLDDDGNPKAAKLAKLLDDGPRLQAVDRIVKIGAERRRLLGLDEPQELRATLTQTSPEVLERIRRAKAQDD